METLNLIFEVISLAILVAATIYGGIHLFKKDAPLYFKLFVIAVGCRAIERLIIVVTIICGISESDVSVASFLGSFSYALFGVAATRGVLDSIVDDKSNTKNKPYRLLAFIFPIICGIPFIFILYSYVVNVSLFTAAVLSVAVIPALIAGYYNFKFLILPPDEVGFLKVTRPINLMVCIALLVGLVNNYLSSVASNSIFAMIVRLIVFIICGSLSVIAVQGAKKWKTLI